MEKKHQKFLTEDVEHHFCISIPHKKSGEVVITENYIKQEPDLPPVISEFVKPRVIISRSKWELIAPTLRHEFNDRMKKMKKKAANWKIGCNEVSRAFGKELVVLAWAIEQTDEDRVLTAIQNWLGLSPEERWWLYTQANAATGHAEKGRGKGWRKAIEVALTENPVNQLDADLTVSSSKGPIKTTDDLRRNLTII